jgi:ATP-dependent RNA helicase RhlE
LTSFNTLGLSEPLLRAVAREGYDQPTPIQSAAIPALLKSRDLLGIAQTGTGKTAAFSLPILHRLTQTGDGSIPPATPGGCRCLVLVPTRELATQVAESFAVYGRFMRPSIVTIVGGERHNRQIKAMAPGVDVLVATPGRLLDHLQEGKINLDRASIVVLDEADHMLDLGFLVPVKKILSKTPKKRQTIFFSATMPEQIALLAKDILRDPEQVSVAPVATTAERVDQRVVFVDTSAKRDALIDLLRDPALTRTLVFARTKHGADKIVRFLDAGGIRAHAIHGNKSNVQRERALADFKSGHAPVLIATDIAARGIDVDDVSHVINFDLPHVPETYVHRIGRTARAGASGKAISLCAPEERPLLRDIEKLTRQPIPILGGKPNLRLVASTEPAPKQASATSKSAKSEKAFKGEKPFKNQKTAKSDKPFKGEKSHKGEKPFKTDLPQARVVRQVTPNNPPAKSKGEIDMATGTVKWFNSTKGYGFIAPDAGGDDVFVHISALERSGMRAPVEGQKLSYDLQRDPKKGKMSATNLKAA